MLLSQLITELERIKAIHGDIQAVLQSDAPRPPLDMIINTEDFFIVTEKYEDGWQVNLRTWPY